MAIEAFRPNRVMWGSDYPPVSSREGYAHSLEYPMQYLSNLSEEDRAWIFGRSGTDCLAAHLRWNQRLEHERTERKNPRREKTPRIFLTWCRSGDSNPDARRHYPLKIACLPVSPLRQEVAALYSVCVSLPLRGVGDSASEPASDSAG